MYLAASGSELVDAVSYALSSANYKMLDSAKIYKNEADAGLGIKKSKVKREDVFVVTKLFTTSVGREGAIAEIEDSLNKMDIGYIDQYLLHCPQGGKVLECYDVLLDYQKKGLIKSVGVSNFGIAHLEALKNSGRALPQVNQIELHPWCTNEDVVNWCRQNSIQIVGYAPLAEGRKLNHPYVLEQAKKYNKTPAQILIRWSLQKGNYILVFMIV
jgi:diketogulonate reductase-like aldo/keto reductase